MITNLYLHNFKSHRDTNLEIAPLTILTGTNGSGKSSVLQSLLLLRQSYFQNRLHEVLLLKGNLCDIGVGSDAIYQFAADDFLRIEVRDQNGNLFEWDFSAKETVDYTSTFLSAINKGMDDEWNTLSLFNEHFQYISAGRLPRFEFKRDDLAVRDRKLSLEKGYCELVAQYLDLYGNEKVNELLIHSPNDFKELKHQVTSWEREINPNVNVYAKKANDSFSVIYSFNGKGTADPTGEFKAENVGYGLTYALPVIVAILSAPRDSLLLIENPEAHLHPNGQSRLAWLMALAAQNGVQLVIETHSDHIINGILVACKKFEEEQKGIDKQNVRLYFFGEKDEKHASTVEEIQVLGGGKIDKQPNGFFDQTQHDLEIIMGF